VRARQRRFSGGALESGTVVPRSKTPRAQGGRAYDRLPSFAALIPKCQFDIHDAILAHRCCTKKPTVGFQARFFWEGLEGRIRMRRNGLKRKKSQKTEKTQKKVSFCMARTPVFLQNGPKKGPFFLSNIGSNFSEPALAVAAEELAPVLAPRVFWWKNRESAIPRQQADIDRRPGRKREGGGATSVFKMNRRKGTQKIAKEI